MSEPPDFDTPRLAARIEALSADEIDRLPYGVIGLDPSGEVRVYNATEARQSGMKERPVLGKSFFLDVAPCMDNDSVKRRIERARAEGTLDIAFTFIGDFSDRNRQLSVRVQSGADGGLWIFRKRGGAA